MKDIRKMQMRIAVLLEIDKTGKKNGDIVKGAEQKLILDDAYKKLMQNGKQTIGSKELQFILYYLKKDGIVDVPSRGLYVKNDLTIAERKKAVTEFLNLTKEKDFDKGKIMLKSEFMKAINEIITIVPNINSKTNIANSKSVEKKKNQ